MVRSLSTTWSIGFPSKQGSYYRGKEDEWFSQGRTAVTVVAVVQVDKQTADAPSID